MINPRSDKLLLRLELFGDSFSLGKSFETVERAISGLKRRCEVVVVVHK